MPIIEIADTGIVYGNPMPQLRSRHAYFPTAVQLDDGDLLVGMNIGSAFESLDMRSYVSRSSDQGNTWSEPRQIFQPDQSKHPVSTSCRIGKLDDGTLIGWISLFDRTREDHGLANPKTDGFCRTNFATIRSADGGDTWSAVEPVDLPVDWRHFEICAPPYQTEKGRLLVVTHPFPDWNGRLSPWGQDGKAFLSEDRGWTWTDMVHVFGEPEEEFSFNEMALTRLTDGRILAVSWAIDHRTEKKVANRMATSQDGGRSFENQRLAPLQGETCRPLGLEDNQLLAVYRRTDQCGLWAHLAKIEGNDWKPIDEKLLWGGNVIGSRTDLDSKFAQMSTLRFGCPAVLRLDRKSVV